MYEWSKANQIRYGHMDMSSSSVFLNSVNHKFTYKMKQILPSQTFILYKVWLVNVDVNINVIVKYL